MKKVLIFSLLLCTCTNINNAQQAEKDYEQKLQTVTAEIEKSNRKTDTIIRTIKKLSNQKVIYRTRTITKYEVDTVYVCPDTTLFLTYEDSIAIFNSMYVPDTTKFQPKKKKKNVFNIFK